ncbi:MAG: putative cobaltochelatase [Euryarchaeota archaeon]|nr:putative cobaltochelatase [Euryarchaeota archaeon]
MTHHIRREILPFTAIVGQEKMKKSLILNAINPRIGGVLIRGEKGTAKSTAVRALAELLPEIEVVNGCSFNCNPYDEHEMCDLCYAKKTNGENLNAIKRRMWVVDLPLGATEDRVVGSIDVEKAIKEGIKALEPGILAAANRGILYIDEVNLLDDHVADVILDSAAMSINVVEREGVSVSHPSKFILVGTMNPEEGELRPQLLDRFGLQASVESIDDADKRVEIVKLVGSFERNPEEFRARFEGNQKELREKIEQAKKIVNEVEIADGLLKITADTCIKLGVRTHRAEIVIDRTAKTIAALDGRKKVTFEDIKEAMELALPHRMRRKPFEPPSLDTEKLDDMMSDKKKQHEEEKEENKQQQRKEEEEKREKEGDSEHKHKNEQLDENPKSEDDNDDVKEPQKESVFNIGDPIDTRAVRQKQKKDKTYRRKISGRRIPTLSLRNNGKYVRHGFPKGEIKDVALDATIRTAAPYQKERRVDSNSDLAMVIKTKDIREKIRVGKISTATMFVVDASGSMGANRRMESAKGAVLSLLLDSYQQRDKVGLVAFRGNQADTLLPLCSSIDLAYKGLKELPTGGRTPLAAGLEKGLNLLLNEKQKDEGVIPVLLLISDGRANVSSGSGNKEIEKELLALAEQARAKGINMIVIDTEVVSKSFIQMQLGYCREIASYSGGKYYPIGDLTSQAVQDIVIQERERSLSNDLQSVLG